MMGAGSHGLKALGAVGVCALLAMTAQVALRSRSEAAAVATQTAPLFNLTIPTGYRDWHLISVAHEAGNLDDIRAILGNDLALRAYREGTLPFPDGSMIARIAWAYVPSEENNKVFGRDQSFIAGAPSAWYLQIMVKDSKKYSATGGWGYAQFDKDGNPADQAKHETCYPCHVPAKDRDYVFTRYAP